MTAPRQLTVEAAVQVGTFRLELALTAAPGETVGVLGPNGAGKSVLLRALAGLVPLSAGSIRLGGTVLDDVDTGTFVPPRERPVGLVFQDYRLFPHLNVLDNVAFGPRSRGVGRREARAVAAAWLKRLDVAALTDRRPGQISGGQAQRVALARALATDPRLLLFDEPMAALDARTRLDVRAELRRHLRGFPGPVLLVTHDPLEAMVLADRLVVLEHGSVVQQGTPGEVARRPVTDYVARLVGLNLYAGTLDPATGAVALDQGGSLVVTHGGDSADRVVVSLRPSAITVHTERPEHASHRNVWPGTIVALERLTDRVRIEVDGAPPALVDVTAAAVADLGLHQGQAVFLAAKATETDAYPGAG